MKTFFLCFFSMLSAGVFSQNIGINTDGSAPHNQALLHVSADALAGDKKRGFLGPSMTTAERDASFPFPVEGLEIYNTTIHCKEFYNGTVWVPNCGGASLADCPPGMMDFGTFCVETDLRPQTNLTVATNTCRNLVPEARFCSWVEWSAACLSLSISSMGDNWEWGSETPQSNNGVIIGGGSCFFSMTSAVGDDHYFRCCRPKTQ